MTSSCAKRSGSRALRNTLQIVLTVVLAMMKINATHANGTKILVPAYANPCCDGGPALWNEVNSFAAANPSAMGVVLNPASGPGASPIDPNYIGANGQGPLITLLSTGVPVYGYVATTYSAKPIDTALAEIALYYDSAYWRGQPVHLSGIFFDEMSNDLANVGYYQTLRDAVRAHDANAYIIGNPGVGETTNTSNQTLYTDIDFGAVFSAILVFENADSVFPAMYSAPTWQASTGAAQLAIVVHTVPDDQRMRVDMSREFARSASWIYITDATEPNPYAAPPPFLLEEVALLPELVFVDDFE